MVWSVSHPQLLSLFAAHSVSVLLETLVVPSIVLGFRHLIDHVWRNEKDLDIVLQIMQVLVRPASTQGEAQSMHTALLSVVADDLDRFLRDVRQLNPVRKEIEPLLQEVGKHADYCRASTRISNEAMTWDNPAPTTVLQELGNNLNSLCTWGVPSLMSSLPLYSHESLLVAVQICGAVRVVRSILDLLVLHMQSGSGDEALDIATAIICGYQLRLGPFVGGNAKGLLSLREALEQEHATARDIINTDPMRAQNTVLLHRRVQDQLSPRLGDLPIPTPLQLDMPSTMDGLGVDGDAIAGMENGDGMGMDIGVDQNTQMLDFGAAEDNAFDLAMESQFEDGDMIMFGADAQQDANQQFQTQEQKALKQQEQQIFGDPGQGQLQGAGAPFGQQQPTQGQDLMGLGVEEGTEDDFWNSLGAGGYDASMGF